MSDERIGPSGDRVLTQGGTVYRIDQASGELSATGLDESVLPILDSIDTYKTKDAHTQDRVERYEGLLSLSEVRGILDALEREGLLLGQDSLLAEISKASPAPENNEPPTLVLVPTSKPVHQTVDVLRTIADQLAQEDRSERRLVLCAQDAVDDESATLLEDLNPAGVSVSYMDRESFSSWIDSMCPELSAEERRAVERATGVGEEGGFRAGANRNRMLLVTAGRRFVATDDDQPSRCCRLGGQPLLVCSRFNPLEYTPYAGIEELQAHVEFSPFDPLRMHGAYLSQPIGRLLAGQNVEISAVQGRFLRELRAVGGTVSATSLGLAGDIGQRTPLLMLMTEGRSLEALIDSGSRYRKLLLSTVGVAAAPLPTVTSSSLFRSSHCGYDNTVPLPPFPPAGRNEDGVFGAALSKVYGPGAILHLPFAVEHIPKRRDPLGAEVLTDSAYRANDILLLLILQWSPRAVGATAPSRYRHLAAYLEDIASGSERSIRALGTEVLAQQTSGTIFTLQRLLETFGTRHKQWRADVEMVIGLGEERLRRGKFLEEGLDWRAVQNHVAEYGRLLQLWPELWGVAKETPFEGRGVRSTIPT